MSTRNQHTTLVLAFNDGSHGTMLFGSTNPGFTDLRGHLSLPGLVKAWVIHGRVVQTYTEEDLRALRAPASVTVIDEVRGRPRKPHRK